MAVHDQTITMAALGRPFRLGMVYDCRSDTLIPGITLWDPKKLKDSIDRQPQHNTKSQIIASDSTSDKASSLDVSASLKGSFLGGLIEVEGSAKFLQDTKKSTHQARVTLNYSGTTHFQQLTMGQMAQQNITYPDVFDKGIATHVVTGILYGAHAFFVFDQEASSSVSVQDIQGKLRVYVAKIPLISIEGKGEVKMNEEEKATVQNFSCTFYGDFKLRKNPTSYMEALDLYARLPELLGENSENAVPLKVWLYPLSLLDSKAAKLVREISSRLISDAEKALEKLLEADMRSNDLLKDPICTDFPEIQRKIQQFKDLCQQYKLDFQKQLARTLPSIRGGGAEETVLVDILKKNEQSAFNASRLKEFLDLKYQEITFVTFFVGLSKGKVSSQDDLVKRVLNPTTDTTYAFTFTSLQAKEPYFEELNAALEQVSESTGMTSAIMEKKSSTPWFEDNAVREVARNAAMLFADLSLGYQAEEKFQFVVTSTADENNPGAVIIQYQNGSLKGTRLDVLPKPDPPTISRLSRCGVELIFKPAESTKQEVSGYDVQHRALGQKKWISEHVKEEQYTVTVLDQDVKFEFRYAVESKSGRSPFSDVIESYNGCGYFLHEKKE